MNIYISHMKQTREMDKFIFKESLLLLGECRGITDDRAQLFLQLPEHTMTNTLAKIASKSLVVFYFLRLSRRRSF